MSLDDPNVAAAVRDAMRKVAADAVEQGAAKPRFGRVISINFTAMTATVWFPGDPSAVSVKLFSSSLPGQWEERYGLGSNVSTNSFTGFGSQVAVQNFNGTQYITHVLTGGQFSVDFATAGNLQIGYGQTGDPAELGAGDYVYTTLWDTSVYPNNGGPYAVNIGPFLSSQSGAPGNSTHEIEIISYSGLSQKYEFNLDPYYALADNNSGSIYDRWLRVIPKLVNEINKGGNTSRQLNATSTPWLGVTGEWVNEPSTSVTASSAFSHSGSGWSYLVQSSVAATAVIGMRTNVKYQVIGGAKYQHEAYVYSPTTWADVRVAIDWYDSANVLISTFLPAASSIAANTWTYVSAGTATAPSNAAYAIPRGRIGGTPPTTQPFYFDDIFFRTADAVTKTDFTLDVSLRKTIHGSRDTDPTNSYGEMWIRIYIHWLDSVGNPNWTVRVKNTAGWTQAKSTKTSKTVYEYITNPPDAVGYLGYHDSGVGYSANATSYVQSTYSPWSSGPWRNPDLTLASRAQEALTGGGLVTWSGTNLKWTAPFEIGGMGRSRNGLTVGTAQISMPTTGSIPVFPGGTTVALSASGVPLQPGQSLWFGIPPGLASGTIPNNSFFGGGLHAAGGLFIVDNVNSLQWWSPPEWAVFLAYRGTDANQPEIKLGTGNKIDKMRFPTLINGWGNWGSGFANTSYTMINGLVVLHGVPAGASKTAGTIFVLPVGWRPALSMLFMTAMSDSTGIVSVSSDGSVNWYNGTATWVALDNIRFIPEQ